jgi:hypothetical protein
MKENCNFVVLLLTGAFDFKKLLGFTSFFKDPVRLGNRTYRAWGLLFENNATF